MKIGLFESLLTIGIGVIGLLGSLKLHMELSTFGVQGPVGPAKYTGALSLILIICGIAAVIGYLRRRRSSEVSDAARLGSLRGMILVGVLFAYVAAVPIVGYLIGSLCFFPALFYVCGLRPWVRSLLVGLVVAVLYHIIFGQLAQVPVPKGWVWI